MTDLLLVYMYTDTLKIPGTNQEIQDICNICISKYNNLDIITFLQCKHAFHYDCIAPWVDKHNTCPCCRNQDFYAILSKQLKK
jgi:hypothetical protein